MKVKLQSQISEHLPIHLLLSQDVPQVLQERQGDQGMGMPNLHIPRYCLYQTHKILQFWGNVIYSEKKITITVTEVTALTIMNILCPAVAQ